MSDETAQDANPWVDPDHSGFTDDEWHSHKGEAPPQYAHGSVSPLMIFGVGLGGFIIVVVCIVLITVYFKMESQKEISAKQEVSLASGFRAKQASWEEQLTGYAWVDAQAGDVRIPLDKAMTKVAERYAEGQ